MASRCTLIYRRVIALICLFHFLRRRKCPSRGYNCCFCEAWGTEVHRVAGMATHKVPLRSDDPTSPFALAVTWPPPPTAMSSASCPTSTLPNNHGVTNFLATQVWPSARVASKMIETHLPSFAPLYSPNIGKENSPLLWRVYELGCGPGLPSLTAAKLEVVRHVWATDMDPLALQLVEAAAAAQALADKVSTRRFDLVSDTLISLQQDHDHDNGCLRQAVLYILADVFESGAVAKGAAALTCDMLAQESSYVWVFAQSDRVQREVYLQEIQRLWRDANLAWRPVELGPPSVELPFSAPAARLWLGDVDETTVNYL